MNKWIYILLVIGCISWEKKVPFETVQVTLLPSSKLSVKGSSNINRFECMYDLSTLPKLGAISYSKNQGVLEFSKVWLHLLSEGFDCGSKLINKDFRELLQTHIYPNIGLQLEKIVDHSHGLTAYVEIEIAGKKSRYAIPVHQPGNHTTYTAVLALDITDFGLTPPKKMLGAIVVHKEIEIHINFDLDIRF